MVQYNDDTLQITVTKGDNASLTISFQGDIPPDGTQLIVSLKKNPMHTESIWQLSTEKLSAETTFSLSAQHTDLIPGTYWWDCRLVYAGDIVYTPMNPSKFIITKVVGNVR